VQLTAQQCAGMIINLQRNDIKISLLPHIMMPKQLA